MNSPSRKLRGLTLRIVLSIVLLVALLVVFAISRFQQPPTIPQGIPNGELAFISNRDGNWEIYILDAQGNARNVTADPADDYFPSWAFDSEQINFVSDRTGELGPTQIKPDGSEARSLTILSAITTLFFENRLDWDPQWSPDGNYLWWASLRDFNLELYVMDKDGENVTRVTDNPSRDWFGSWSPDNQQLVFSSDREGNENIYSIDITGENLRQLTDDGEDDLRPIWSLDGRQIAFVSERENPLPSGVMDVFVMNPDGSDQHKLTPETTFEGGLMRSADGTQFVYMSNRDGHWHLYARAADCEGDSCARRLTDGDSDNLFPVWRP
jgi:Tol biopolymer transport system component